MFNTPLAITPAKAEMVMAALADRFGITKLFRANGDAVAMSEFGFDDSDDAIPDRYYDVVAGVAIIPITGTLVQKSGYMRPVCGMTGYDGIRANLSMALEDDGVQAIMLDIDSGGGEVAGCFDLVDAIYNARGRKPIWAVLSECAYSAAYAIASAADRIIVPRTGGTGSVGVICAHVDFSKALAKEGVTVTMIHYGDRKADGSEYVPLSDAALARFQADVDAMGELFVATVARNRNLSAAKVRDTQATTFLGADGVEIGFADAVMAPDEAFRSLLAELG
ncbi:S49 family peptidase [Paraburkholderia atlantica]|uniref:S49 family peptidase n=1 Tax=Paraburkholderia atlantica TaxID=2654982 RepID=UPI0017BF97AD|nr:S49 family peptidase [Paraburkholderia atlantica]MBB5414099.1 signal peptide peptidase SppA [Paraburkholderia atlantica]